MKKNKLILHPKDYLVMRDGLKIENTSNDLVLEINIPIMVTVYPDKQVKVASPVTPEHV